MVRLGTSGVGVPWLLGLLAASRPLLVELTVGVRAEVKEAGELLLNAGDKTGSLKPPGDMVSSGNRAGVRGVL